MPPQLALWRYGYTDGGISLSLWPLGFLIYHYLSLNDREVVSAVVSNDVFSLSRSSVWKGGRNDLTRVHAASHRPCLIWMDPI